MKQKIILKYQNDKITKNIIKLNSFKGNYNTCPIENLEEFIENNLNKDVNKRNKIELLNFLKNDTITTEELYYVGL